MDSQDVERSRADQQAQAGRTVEGMPLELTTKGEATRVITNAKTLATTTIRTTAELDAFVRTLREQLPATLVVAK